MPASEKQGPYGVLFAVGQGEYEIAYASVTLTGEDFSLSRATELLGLMLLKMNARLLQARLVRADTDATWTWNPDRGMWVG